MSWKSIDSKEYRVDGDERLLNRRLEDIDAGKSDIIAVRDHSIGEEPKIVRPFDGMVIKNNIKRMLKRKNKWNV